MQVLCDPFEGNSRFSSEPSGDMDFAHIAFGLADQVRFGPAQLVGCRNRKGVSPNY